MHQEPQSALIWRRVLPRLRYDQRRIAAHPARFKVVACGRRWGKTTLGLSLAIGHALAGRRVWWVAPTYLLAYHPWRTFIRRFASEWERKTEYDHHIDLPSGGFITVKTADNPDGLRGVGLDFVVVDEAAFIAEEVWQNSLRPALSDHLGSALIISTPRGRNWFHRMYRRGADPDNADWAAWHYPTASNPAIDSAEIAEARDMLPEHVFNQEYMAEFLEDGGTVFRFVQRAAVAPLNAQPLPDHEYMLGVDFGRYKDFTACVVIDRDTKQMVDIDRFKDRSWGLQRQRIKGLAHKWNCTLTVVEANAMGDPNIEILRNEGLRIERFTTTSSNKPPLIENLVAAIENGDLTIQPDSTLLSELATFTYKTTPLGHTSYNAPAGLHDDTVIALALAWKAASVPKLWMGVAVV